MKFINSFYIFLQANPIGSIFLLYVNIMDAKIIYNKYKNTKIKEIYEIILQWYLISTGYRNVALVYVKSKSKLEKIMRFLKKNNISYRIFEKDLVLYNPKKFNINELDTSNIKKFGEQIKNYLSFLSLELENL